MARDLRKLFERERKEKRYAMKSGHAGRFQDRLEREFPKQNGKRSYFRLSVAASLVLALGLGIYWVSQTRKGNPDSKTTIVDVETKTANSVGISLGDLSPDLKKIEDYYVANINLQLSALEFDTSTKTLVDGYMERLAELDQEYERLNTELNTLGPNDDIIAALIKNLQLRLQLLQRLKTKLNQLKSSKNEQKSSYSI